MSFVHRQLLSWFLVALTLALLVFRLDQTTRWSWYIVFTPAWLLHALLLVNIVYRMFAEARLRAATHQGHSAWLQPVLLHSCNLLLAGLVATFQALLCHNLRCLADPAPSAADASDAPPRAPAEVRACLLHWCWVFAPLLLALGCLSGRLLRVLVLAARAMPQRGAMQPDQRRPALR